MKKPPELQTQLLSLLWDQGPSTVRELMDKLPDGKPRAYTTLLTTMQVMDRQGLVGRTREGNKDRWHALVSREEVSRPFLKDLLTNLFKGRPSAAIESLVNTEELSNEELDEIERIIRAKREANQ